MISIFFFIKNNIYKIKIHFYYIMEPEENKAAADTAFDKIESCNYNLSNSEEEDDEDDNDNSNKYDKELNNENMNKKNKKIWNPRPYQLQIYNKALTQNSIIFVETGKGKTFISIMLMANHLGVTINDPDNNKKINKKKKIIFFVCDTALIAQQKKMIEDILNVEVGTIQGKKDKKSKSDYEAFLKKWNSFSVFVAIPSIIYKILSCGFINIFQITMLIFDECHHTNLDHPYNKIMDEFYFFYKKKNINEYKFPLPRIYGLTASPMKNRIGGNSRQLAANEALIKLSENLDSVVIIDPEVVNFKENIIDLHESQNKYVTIKSHVDSKEYKNVIVELKGFFNKIVALAFSNFSKKLEINYATKENYLNYLKYVVKKFQEPDLVNYNNICQENSDLYNLQNYNRILYIFEKMQRDIFLILENLCLESLIIYFDLSIQLYEKLYQKKTEEEEKYQNDDENLSTIIDENESEEEDEEELILQLDADIIEKIKNKFQEINKTLKEKNNKKGLNYTSDRLNKLYYTIYKLFQNNPETKIIVFITNRIVAHILQPTLTKYLTEKFPNKKCEEIIGVNNRRKNKSSLTLTPTITLNKLNKIVKDFNENKFDILLGTSAVEEGLDIQSCNAVISLVEIQTLKSYIQMKGRARKNNSKFYIFSYSEEETIKKVKAFLDIQNEMKVLFKDDIIKDFRRKNYLNDKKDFIFHFDKNTHSKLTLQNASIFFNEVKQSIESSGINFNCTIKKETLPYSNPPKFIGKINLSMNISNFKKGFKYETEPCSSKNEAEKMCHFLALKKLIDKKILDEHFKFCKDKVQIVKV